VHSYVAARKKNDPMGETTIPNVRHCLTNPFVIDQSDEDDDHDTNVSSEGSEIMFDHRQDVIQHSFVLEWIHRYLDDNPNAKPTAG
jgi:hypothetical protein